MKKRAKQLLHPIEATSVDCFIRGRKVPRWMYKVDWEKGTVTPGWLVMLWAKLARSPVGISVGFRARRS